MVTTELEPVTQTFGTTVVKEDTLAASPPMLPIQNPVIDDDDDNNNSVDKLSYLLLGTFFTFRTKNFKSTSL
jgi:hypothetical protein